MARIVREGSGIVKPAAVVPVYTPEEAMEEVTYAVRDLGFRVIMISNHV